MRLPTRRLFTIGVLSEQSFHKKRNTIFVNQACFILLICALAVFVCNIFFGFYMRALVPASSIPLFLSVFWLQKKQKYFVAKVLIIAVALSTGLWSTFLFGDEAQTQYYIFASFALGMVLFPKQSQHIALFITHFICFSFLILYLKENPPIFLGQDTSALAYFHVPLIFTCVFITLSEFVAHYKRYETRIKDLMKDVNEHSDLLQIEKTKFEVQAQMLQNTNAQLLAEIEQRQTIEKELLSSNGELEQFAYVASHDLKEPLRTIGSFTQLLKRKLECHFDGDAKEYYRFITEGVQRMSNLLDDLLALSKLNKEYEIEAVNLEETVSQNIRSLNSAIDKHEGKVIVKELPEIKANQAQMNQLFQNLIANGLKFKRDIPPIVEISCREKRTEYLFAIKDNGIGIDKSYAEKVFVIFQRLDKKAKFEGTGIGLAICKKIVQNHKGKIWIESTVGQGTTFFFTISKDLEDLNMVEEVIVDEEVFEMAN